MSISSGLLGPVWISAGLSVGDLIIPMRSGSSCNLSIIHCTCSSMSNPISRASCFIGKPIYCTKANRGTSVASSVIISSLALRAS
jgi:hypothetical protein